MKKTIFIVLSVLLCIAAVGVLGYIHNNTDNAESNKITTTIVSDRIENTDKKVMGVSGLMPYRSESEMILYSDIIICGHVSEIKESKWSNPDYVRGGNVRNILQTDIVVDIDNKMYGDTDSKSVVVRINKGEDENTIFCDENTPDFTLNENVLLFLARDDSDVKTDEDYYVLVAKKQSKYVLPDNEAMTSAYSYDNQTIDLTSLQQRIIDEKTANPNFKQELEIEHQRIKENNALLFGE